MPLKHFTVGLQLFNKKALTTEALDTYEIITNDVQGNALKVLLHGYTQAVAIFTFHKLTT